MIRTHGTTSRRLAPAAGMMHKRWPRFACVTLLLAVAAGCGQTLPSLSGKLLAGDKPVPEGTISFRHKESGAIARASVQPDGAYAVKTGNTRGLALGDYEIAVAAVKGIPDPNNPDKAKRWVSPKHADFETSGLSYTVQSGNNVYDIVCEPGNAW